MKKDAIRLGLEGDMISLPFADCVHSYYTARVFVIRAPG